MRAIPTSRPASRRSNCDREARTGAQVMLADEVSSGISKKYRCILGSVINETNKGMEQLKIHKDERRPSIVC